MAYKIGEELSVEIDGIETTVVITDGPFDSIADMYDSYDNKRGVLTVGQVTFNRNTSRCCHFQHHYRRDLQ